jgi:single-stranded DNA-binding protein
MTTQSVTQQQKPNSPPQPVTLTGFLGSDREIRWTPERTEVRIRKHKIAQVKEAYEVTIPARPYAVLSMATQKREGSQWKTTWHRLVVWNVYRTMEHFAALLGRKGDRITVTGYREIVELDNGHPLTQIVVQDLRILQHKIHEEVE